MPHIHPLAKLKSELVEFENPATILRLADNYLQQVAELGDSFVLPKQYTVIHPILEYYAGDLAGWVDYVKRIRDAFGPRSQARTDLHALYRTLSIRHVQQIRRERLNAAIAKAIALHLIPDDPEAKRRYEKRCVVEWGMRRDALLNEHRGRTHTGRLSTDEREEILARFWQVIDTEVNNGEVPEP